MRNRVLSLLLVLAMAVSLFAGLSLTVNAGSVPAVDPTGITCAEDVEYVKVGSYVCNWGARGEDCTFLSTYAQAYYTGNYTFEKMSVLAGGTQQTAPSSALYTSLKSMMEKKSTHTTSYQETRDLYKYTDCLQNDYSHISSFYSGKELNGAWDGGATWNREHTWPNSKIDNNGENDIMMLRPTWVQENSSRGNMAYGEKGASGYFYPNQTTTYDVRGDCARIVLYVYTRWGVTNTMWGSSGVMQNLDVLLKWMEEDPVDTWEMGRNDACQSILGVRNVFVDYPEYAWLLFNKTVPADYVSPSGGVPVAYEVTASSNNEAWGTVSVSGNVITCTPANGYCLDDYEIDEGEGSISANGNVLTVTPASDCHVSVTFAPTVFYTVSYIVPAGVSKPNVTVSSGTKVELTAPVGIPTDDSQEYTFAGWLPTALEDTAEQPADLILPGTTYTVLNSVEFYAVYSYEKELDDEGSGLYVKVAEPRADWSGDYVIVYEGSDYMFDSSLETLDVASNYDAILEKPNNTIKADDADPYKVTIEKYNGGYSILCSNGKYMGVLNSDNTITSFSSPVVNTIEMTVNGDIDIVCSNCFFRFNKQSGQTRFRYYKASSYTSQQPVYLYRKEVNSTETHYLTLAAVDCLHENTELQNELDPTCTVDGYTGDVYCLDCDELITEGTVIPATGHSYVEGVCEYCEEPCPHENTELRDAKEPSCTEIGYTGDTWCLDCGMMIASGEPIWETSHLFHNGFCEVCGEPCPHDNQETYGYEPATCTEEGHTGDTYCLDCDMQLTLSDILVPLGHDFVDGYCTRCGEPDPDYDHTTDPCQDYTDINREAWYHSAVDYVICRGLMGSTKTDALTFEPETKVSRAMVASIIYRIAGNEEEVEYQGTFSDVPEGKWYTTAIEWCAKNGLASGKGDGIFDPDGNVTRQELAVFFYKLAEFLGNDVSGRAELDSFADAKTVPAWSKDYLAWAVDAGIISGQAENGKTSLNPTAGAMRSELASILTRFMGKFAPQ